MARVKLADIATIITGNTPKTSDDQNYASNDICFVKPSDIDDNELTDVHYTEYYISEYARNKARILPPQSILVTCIGIVGKVGINAFECAFNQQINAVIPDREKCDCRYLAYALQYAKPKLQSIANAPVVPILKKSQFSNIDIFLPSLAEQRKIAAVLDKVSDLIAKRRQQLTKLDELVKAKFVEMFGGKDYPSQELISLIKDGAGLSYGIVQPGDDGTGDMGVLRPVDFVDGKINVTSIKYIDRTVGEAFKKTELAGNELLITVRGTTGITALTDNSFAGMNVTRGIAVIRYDYDKIDPLYLNSYLKMDESQRYIQEHTHGATLQQINLSDLRVQPILVPPREKQEQFAIFVKQTEKMKTAISSSLDKLETLKKALMQKYFK